MPDLFFSVATECEMFALQAYHIRVSVRVRSGTGFSGREGTN